jgi:hypothetical protein
MEGWERILTKLKMGVPAYPAAWIGRHPVPSWNGWMDGYGYILMNDWQERERESG